jgi:hypothetical protein
MRWRRGSCADPGTLGGGGGRLGREKRIGECMRRDRSGGRMLVDWGGEKMGELRREGQTRGVEIVFRPRVFILGCDGEKRVKV